MGLFPYLITYYDRIHKSGVILNLVFLHLLDQLLRSLDLFLNHKDIFVLFAKLDRLVTLIEELLMPLVRGC